MSVLFFFIGFFILLFGWIIRESKRRPIREWEPKPGDRYFSEVFTRTALGGGRVLTVQFHPTLEEASNIVKKNAQWFDDYGNIHQDVGIYWNVGTVEHFKSREDK